MTLSAITIGSDWIRAADGARAASARRHDQPRSMRFAFAARAHSLITSPRQPGDNMPGGHA